MLAQEGEVTSTTRMRDGCWLGALAAGKILRVSEGNFLEFMASARGCYVPGAASEREK